MSDKRILVCGSRDLGFQRHKPTEEEKQQYFFVCRILDEVVKERGWIHEPDDFGNWLPRFRMIHGAAFGVDSCADDYAIANWIPCTTFPANWSKYGKKAGYLRNKEMLEVGKPDLVVAIYKSKSSPSRGTSMMADIAKKAGVEVLEFYYSE